MRAKEYLMRVRASKMHMEALRLELEQMRETIGDVAAGIGGDIRGKGGKPGSRVESTLIRIETLEEKLQAELDTWSTAYQEADALIDQMEDICDRELLRMRYLTGLTWEAIAEVIGRDVRTAKRWHGKALLALEPMIPEE